MRGIAFAGFCGVLTSGSIHVPLRGLRVLASGGGNLVILVDQQFKLCGLWTGCLTVPSAFVENNTRQRTHVQHNSNYSVVSCAELCDLYVYSAVVTHTYRLFYLQQ